MPVVLIGMNHKTAPVEIRERLALSCDDPSRAITTLRSLPHLREVLYLSTCNRVEVLADLQDETRGIDRIKAFIFSHGNLPGEELESCLYVYRGDTATRHLFRVASSLDSMVMGEPQILGQVKEAYRMSVENGTSGLMINKLLHHAFRVAKRVRTETAIAFNAVSVSYAAVALAKKIFGGLGGKTVLLIGAGEMSELAARHLLKNGAGRIIVANRTFENAVRLAEEFQGVATGFDALEEHLKEADIVISSTGSAGFVVTADMARNALRRRKNRLLFLIDIAVPRDIDPAAGEIDNVYLYNIDHLQEIVDENLKNRLEESEKAERIVEEEVIRFAEWRNTLEVVPTIRSLKDRADAIIHGEMEKSFSWIRELREEDRERVEILVHGVVNKILHGPVTSLKEASQNDGTPVYVAAVRDLFHLDGPGSESGRQDGGKTETEEKETSS